MGYKIRTTKKYKKILEKIKKGATRCQVLRKPQKNKQS